jgi:thiol-disulfide isomerase/thioredoxin
VAVVLTTLLACSASDRDADEPGPAGDAYAAPFRSDAELRALLDATCRMARQEDEPRVLIEFSAAWCSDCRRLHEMKQAPTLARELEAWPRVVVNVGRFDRHRDLLDALGVTSIAHWSVFEPTRCDAPLPAWPRRASRTLEVSSGAARDLTPEDLADWLAEQRAR